MNFETFAWIVVGFVIGATFATLYFVFFFKDKKSSAIQREDIISDEAIEAVQSLSKELDKDTKNIG